MDSDVAEDDEFLARFGCSCALGGGPGVSKATTPGASSASPSTAVASAGSGRPRSADSAMLSRCVTNGTPSNAEFQPT